MGDESAEIFDDVVLVNCWVRVLASTATMLPALDAHSPTPLTSVPSVKMIWPSCWTTPP